MNKQQGFTLIELLVVIAIIGILSGIVLSSLNSARGKASNAAVKANLANIRAQAEIVYDSAGGTYAGVCNDSTVQAGYQAAGKAGGGTAVCNGSANAYAISSPLKVSETIDGVSVSNWCVDSTGASRGTSAALGSGEVVCP